VPGERAVHGLRGGSTVAVAMATAPLTGPLERDDELALLDHLLADARAGRGAVAVLEGPAGRGKTTLLRELRRRATDGGLLTLSSVGAELERDFPYGIVRQLLEPVLRGAGDAERERLLAGAAALAAPVFAAEAAPPDAGVDVSHGRLHGLYWLVANLAEEQPLVLVVDDAHWGDRLSLRFLDVLARRVEDLPVLVALGVRPDEPGAEQDLLDRIMASPAVEALRPRDLSTAAVAQLVEAAVQASPDDAFVAACHHATGGNPLLVAELVRTIAAEGWTGAAEEAGVVRGAVPGGISRNVLARLRRLSPGALALARSLAVLGDGARLARVAALAGLAADGAEQDLALLVRSGLLDTEALGFVHPVVRAAVVAELPAPERGRWHARAARIVAGDGGDATEVAAHLLLTEPAGDPWSAHTLAAAGRRALADGAPDVAVRLLRRALAEPPDEADRPDVQLNLALAGVRTGEPDVLRLLEAATSSSDPVAAARATPLLTNALIMRDRGDDAIRQLRRALDEVRAVDADAAAGLEDDLLDVLPHCEELMGEYLATLEHAESRDRPILLVHAAHQRAMEGAPAGDVLPLLRRAFADGRLIEQLGTERFTAFWGIATLLRFDRADEARDLLEDMRAASRRSGSRIAIASLSWVAFRWERLFGDLRRAEDDSRVTAELLDSTGNEAGAALCGLSLTSILLDRGDVDAADQVMRGLPVPERAAGLVGVHALRGRLRHLQGRHEEAVVELEAQFRGDRRRRWVLTDREEARAAYVESLAAVGRREEAGAEADREVALQRRRGVATMEATALMARARVSDEHALDDLGAAVAAARRSGSRFVLAQALCDLGALQRRRGQRSACRGPLAEARDLARRVGATGLEERAHEELVVAGARPQRVALSGIDALTASERRVAELAAQGLRNRDIAETLFVTLKTVEVHLGRVYGKLGIQGRSQLAAALRPQDWGRESGRTAM
jgi:DNA-binding CsgD family transcriptional regulator